MKKLRLQNARHRHLIQSHKAWKWQGLVTTLICLIHLKLQPWGNTVKVPGFKDPWAKGGWRMLWVGSWEPKASASPQRVARFLGGYSSVFTVRLGHWDTRFCSIFADFSLMSH
jgi:hypothetical protein